jgi:hypothetical protein
LNRDIVDAMSAVKELTLSPAGNAPDAAADEDAGAEEDAGVGDDDEDGGGDEGGDVAGLLRTKGSATATATMTAHAEAITGSR